MSETPPSAILFASEKAANHLVAGIPATARAVAALAACGGRGSLVLVSVPGGWAPTACCQAEAQRLAPDVRWKAVDAAGIERLSAVSGVELLIAGSASEARSAQAELVALEEASRQIIRATGKAGDGIVSRHINRPISQAITQRMLGFGWTRPGHATALAALLGLAMIVALVWGGATGLLVGAALFQAASIVDGVDGEMARATQRSSERGAMLDSLTDAATNLGFLAGVSVNVWQQGMERAATAGAIGFVLLALGSAILGWQARRAGGPFTFDSLKHKMRAKPSPLKQALVYITMRDFYALAACLAILVGAVVPLLYVFATVACGWFLVVCAAFLSGLFAHGRGGV